MSFSPQTHNLCQQHFLFADHKPSQFHHQTGPVRRAPFLQPGAFDEACGGQCGLLVHACLLCPLSALLLSGDCTPPGILVGSWQVGCARAWVSLARVSFQSQRKKQHLISRKAPGLYFSAELSFDQWCPGGLLPVWNITYCLCYSWWAVQREASDWEGGTEDHWPDEPTEGRTTRSCCLVQAGWGILLEAWFPPGASVLHCPLLLGHTGVSSGDGAFVLSPQRHSSSVLWPQLWSSSSEPRTSWPQP